jgi:hypothetical protein
MKIKSLQIFHLKALEMLEKSGYSNTDKTKLSSRFRLTGTEVSCSITYDDKLLDLFAMGDSPEICLLDFRTELKKKVYQPKQELNLTL